MTRANVSTSRYDRSKVVFMWMIALMLLAPSSYFNGAEALAQGQAKAVDSMRLDRETTEGVVIGALNKTTNTFSWKGIPYAKPPVGDLRPFWDTSRYRPETM